MKAKLLVVCLLVVAALVCETAVMAVEPMPTQGTTVITGNVAACSIGLTIPVDQSITLTRGNDNIQGLGNVQVLNNCNTHWTVNLVGDNAYMYTTHPSATSVSPTYTFLTTVMSVSTDGTTWTPFAPASSATGLINTNPVTLASGNGAQTIPVYVKQPVTSADAGGDYKIKFTFNLVQG